MCEILYHQFFKDNRQVNEKQGKKLQELKTLNITDMFAKISRMFSRCVRESVGDILNCNRYEVLNLVIFQT